MGFFEFSSENSEDLTTFSGDAEDAEDVGFQMFLVKFLKSRFFSCDFVGSSRIMSTLSTFCHFSKGNTHSLDGHYNVWNGF